MRLPQNRDTIFDEMTLGNRRQNEMYCHLGEPNRYGWTGKLKLSGRCSSERRQRLAFRQLDPTGRDRSAVVKYVAVVGRVWQLRQSSVKYIITVGLAVQLQQLLVMYHIKVGLAWQLLQRISAKYHIKAGLAGKHP